MVAFAFVFAASFATFYVIKKVYGLRVTEAEEDGGLDIAEHGMYGYPEQFIPQGEFPGASTSPTAAASAATAVTASTVGCVKTSPIACE